MAEHWYDRNGAPCYEQVTQKGGLRATDLRDARKLGLVPSVTTVLGVIAKPQLETWKVNQGILAALTMPKRLDEPESDYLKRIMSDSRQQAKDAAEEGTRIHAQIERSYKGVRVEEFYRPHVEATRKKVAELYPDVDDWVPEESFGSAYGYGGKVDLHSPSTGHTIDFKGKDGDFSDGKKLAYDQNFQLGAYQGGLMLPNTSGANIFVSRTHPGLVASHVWTPEEMAYGLDVFMAALKLWKSIKKFDPSFTKETGNER